jgi:hypothetical protein
MFSANKEPFGYEEVVAERALNPLDGAKLQHPPDAEQAVTGEGAVLRLQLGLNFAATARQPEVDFVTEAAIGSRFPAGDRGERGSSRRCGLHRPTGDEPVEECTNVRRSCERKVSRSTKPRDLIEVSARIFRILGHHDERSSQPQQSGDKERLQASNES